MKNHVVPEVVVDDLPEGQTLSPEERKQRELEEEKKFDEKLTEFVMREGDLHNSVAFSEFRSQKYFVKQSKEAVEQSED